MRANDYQVDSVRRKRVEEYYSLVDAGDVAGLVDIFAADAVYSRPGYQPLVGRANLERFYREERVIRGGHHQIRSILVAGEEAAVHGIFDGTLRDDSEVHLRFADFFVFTAEHTFARRDTFFFSPMV